MVYLDYNATTPLAPEALTAMMPFLRAFCGNASSIHAAGRRARGAVDDSRERLATLLGAKAHEIIFTSGGTEACNLAVLGLARAHAPRGRHVITSAVEHHAVLHACESLKHHEGFDLTILPVDGAGRVDPEDLESALRPDTVLVSVMHANNETGTIQPVEELAAICRARRVCFHTDAIQSFGKLPVRAENLGVSAISLAAHKFYGPPGAGALYLRSGIAISRIAHGGSHENTRRPGHGKCGRHRGSWRPPRSSPRARAPPTNLDCVLSVISFGRPSQLDSRAPCATAIRNKHWQIR